MHSLILNVSRDFMFTDKGNASCQTKSVCTSTPTACHDDKDRETM